MKNTNSGAKKSVKVMEYLVIDSCYLDKTKFDYLKFVNEVLEPSNIQPNEFKVQDLFNDVKGIIVENGFGDVENSFYKLTTTRPDGFTDQFNLPQCDAGHHIIIDLYEAVKKGLFNEDYIDGNGWFTKIYFAGSLEELADNLKLERNWEFYREKNVFEYQLKLKKQGKLNTLTFGLHTEELISRNLVGITDKVVVRLDDFSHLEKTRPHNYQYQLFLKNGKKFIITEAWYGWLQSLL